MTASPAWKSLKRVHFLCRKTPRHLSNSEVEAWITVFLGPGGRGFCTNFSHVGLYIIERLPEGEVLVLVVELLLVIVGRTEPLPRQSIYEHRWMIRGLRRRHRGNAALVLAILRIFISNLLYLLYASSNLNPAFCNSFEQYLEAALVESTMQTTTQRARFFRNVARTTDYFVGRRTISHAASFVGSLLRSSSATSTSPPSSSSSSVGRAFTTYVGQPRRSTPRYCYRCARNGSINAERRWSGVETDGECP
ncbi:hypothetical protein ALC56_15176 [Trachymyrmex septentrionalis]|uniref:Uncharacterized protein n=1 Tax=Trachymyrmex septentrionalis TaxID=34720 RepID=A0A195EQC2_9HYME|nr:hypothetical protein ALC56_15176 [Trachymyrmex septentrionalis]